MDLDFADCEFDWYTMAKTIDRSLFRSNIDFDEFYWRIARRDIHKKRACADTKSIN